MHFNYVLQFYLTLVQTNQPIGHPQFFELPIFFLFSLSLFVCVSLSAGVSSTNLCIRTQFSVQVATYLIGIFNGL